MAVAMIDAISSARSRADSCPGGVSAAISWLSITVAQALSVRNLSERLLRHRTAEDALLHIQYAALALKRIQDLFGELCEPGAAATSTAPPLQRLWRKPPPDREFRLGQVVDLSRWQKWLPQKRID